MNQNELAEQLGISPGMVSKLKKRGMPTDNIDRAKRWRKRHLQPGMVKGVKFDPRADVVVDATPAVDSVRPVAAIGPDGAEAMGTALWKHSQDSEKPLSLDALEPLREMLRDLPLRGDRPVLPLGLWLALVDHAIVDHAKERLLLRPDLEMGLSPHAFSKAVAAPCGIDCSWLVTACDGLEFILRIISSCRDEEDETS